MKKTTLFGSVFTALALGFAITAQAVTLSVPTITTPVNGSIMTVAQFVKVDWTDATGGTAPYEYQYESFSDAAYTTSLFLSGWITASEISTVGSAEGDYYVRVRARDSTLAVTAWSNGVENVYKITVDNTPTNVAPVLKEIATPVTIPELSLYNFTATATDANVGNTLTFSLSENINSTTGVFSWTPSEAQGPDTYKFKVRVSDGELTDSQTVKIRVTEVNGDNNDQPTHKKECKKGGWKNFTNPSFRNQGKCVSFVNHLNWHLRHDDGDDSNNHQIGKGYDKDDKRGEREDKDD